jgi:hypothetical protein
MSKMKTETFLKSLAKGIEAMFEKIGNKRLRFALIVWEEDEKGRSRANYVSNCLRSGVRDAMKEMIERWDGEEHKKNVVSSDLN